MLETFLRPKRKKKKETFSASDCTRCALHGNSTIPLPIRINRIHLNVYSHSSAVIDKCNIAASLVYFLFACWIFYLKLNKSTNCVVRHDLRFNQGIHIFPFCTYFILFSSVLIQFWFSRRFVVNAVVVAGFRLKMLCASSLCHALRFRSLHKCSLISSERDICLRIYGFGWKYGNANFHAYKHVACSFWLFFFSLVNEFIYLLLCANCVFGFYVWS